MITEQNLKDEIDKIILNKLGHEWCHISEDELHLKVIKEFCPKWVAEEIDRLSAAKFYRWH